MSEFFVMRSQAGLSPYTMEDAACIAKLHFGKPIKISATEPRNARFLAMYWVLCTRIATAIGSNKDVVSDILKIASGHYTLAKSKTLGEIKLPLSISFAKMDESSFRDFFEVCVRVIYDEWSIARQDVLDAVADILTPTEVRG